jgi:hypothetical protein
MYPAGADGRPAATPLATVGTATTTRTDSQPLRVINTGLIDLDVTAVWSTADDFVVRGESCLKGLTPDSRHRRPALARARSRSTRPTRRRSTSR